MIGLLALLTGCAATDTVESTFTDTRDIRIVKPLGDGFHDLSQRKYGYAVNRELPRINLEFGSSPHGDRVRQAENRREMNEFYDACKASWDYWTD
tara:strand:- start:11097 stop:11381 length:285 start_codon:yes stop_codon:yes gene_type:complete